MFIPDSRVLPERVILQSISISAVATFSAKNRLWGPCSLMHARHKSSTLSHPSLSLNWLCSIIYRRLFCGIWNAMGDQQLIGCPKLVCLFVLFTSSSSTLRGLVKNLDGNEIKNMNININYSMLIFWCSQAFLVGWDLIPYPLLHQCFENVSVLCFSDLDWKTVENFSIFRSLDWLSEMLEKIS